MAIVKPIKVRTGNLAGLRAVLRYVQDSKKTKGGTLVFAKDLLRGLEYQQMVITKQAFHKNTGRQYAHFVQSFDPRDDLTPEQAFAIGQEFLRNMKKWRDFQVVMAVHTNEPHLHINYIVNSVSAKDGSKWQSSPEDLKQMRELSDRLCREHGLHVIEHRKKGQRSYGENHAERSWKKQLAKDVAQALSQSHSRAVFLHQMASRGIEVDIGRKSILFTIPAGTYGLDKERKCSNFKLLSYGDFSTENIRATWEFNGCLTDIGRGDATIMQEVLLELGQIHCPHEPDHYQDMYFHDIEFDGLTRLEIETALSRKALDTLLAKARQAHEQAEIERRQSGQLIATIAAAYAEVLHWQEQRMQGTDWFIQQEDENEFEL